MGDEQQYDETQTGDAKIRDLGCEYFSSMMLYDICRPPSGVEIQVGKVFKGYRK